MKTIKIIDKSTNNTVIINQESISSFEVNYVIDKIDCDDEGIQDLDCIEITLFLNNGFKYTDNFLYIELDECEYLNKILNGGK